MAIKVDFMIVGAQKCGTTTLAAMLRTHCALVCSKPKEPHFFSLHGDWKARLPQYEALFEERPGATYFEASTSYTFFPHRRRGLWDDLYEYNPNLKIIYIVRMPLDRIKSGYIHGYRRGYITCGINGAVSRYPLLLDITRYASQIIPFVRRFGEASVRVVLFEDLISRPVGLVRDLAGFLGVDPDGFGNVREIHENRTPERWRERLGEGAEGESRGEPVDLSAGIPQFDAITEPTLTLDARRRILDLLEPEIVWIEAYSGYKLRSWREI